MTALTRPTLPLIGTRLPEQGGTLGAIMAMPTGDVHGLVVSDREHAFRSAWGVSRRRVPGAIGIDGMASTIAMAAAGSEAAQRILDLRTGGHADWFLASRVQALLLQQCSGELFGPDWHWTSTQCSADGAWLQNFVFGFQDFYHLSSEAWCRPVRSYLLWSFGASYSPAGIAPGAAASTTALLEPAA